MAATANAVVLPKRGHSISDGQSTSLTLDVVPNETHASSNTLTDNPVENGLNVTDHSRPDPNNLTMDCLVSNTPLGQPVDSTRALTAYNTLEQLRLSGTLCTVVTTLKTYTSMGIVSISATRKSENYNALEFTIVFKFVRIVQNKLTTVRVSNDNRVAKKTSTGAVTPDTQPVQQSALAAGDDGRKANPNAPVTGFIKGVAGGITGL